MASDGQRAAARSEIVVDGTPSGRYTEGVVLEAAIAWNGHHLLFMTDGVPHEDYLTIQLLGHDLVALDGVTIGAMYSTGSFSLLELVEPDVVRFRFIGDTDWAVELLRQPELALPLLGDPTGVRRRFGLRRHFRVHGRPRPESAR